MMGPEDTDATGRFPGAGGEGGWYLEESHVGPIDRD